MYLGSAAGGWSDITQGYVADDGTITHPSLPDRILSPRSGNIYEPSFILTSSYRTKKSKEAKARAEQKKASYQERGLSRGRN